MKTVLALYDYYFKQLHLTHRQLCFNDYHWHFFTGFDASHFWNKKKVVKLADTVPWFMFSR